MAPCKTRVARKSTKGTGKRWLKGHSSSTNPDVNTHREAAKGGLLRFNSGGGESTLTTNALLKHNERLETEDDLCVHSQALTISDDLESVEVKTFATNWTTCTNPSFDNFLKNWKPHLSTHKDRLAVLAAVTEVIQENNGKETETEYFAALLTTLNVLDNPELVSACISILCLVIKRVPPNVLKAKFSESTKLFQELLIKYLDCNNLSLIRGLIGCLSVLLRTQDSNSWSNSSVIQTYLVILSLTTHSKPRVRKSAQHAVCVILKAGCLVSNASRLACHPAASHTAKFCIQQLDSTGAVASSTTLQILGLLKNILSLFSTHYVKSTCEAILRWMNVNNARTTTCCFVALYGLFNNRTPINNLTQELNAQLINALYDYQPSPKDTKNQISWITVLREAHLHLLRLDDKLCLSHMVRFVGTLCRLWSTLKGEISSTITATLKNLMYSFDPSLLSKIETQSKSKKGELLGFIQKMFESIESCLGYQYHEVWSSVFQVLSVFFEVFGKVGQSFMKKCLRSMAELRESQNFSLGNELEVVIGQAVKSFGPKLVIECIPLNLEKDSTNLDKSWLIPVLRDNIQETELGFFKEYFLPLLENFNQKALHCKNQGNGALQKTYELLIDQLWSLLPGFCILPTDLTKSFKLIAKDLGRVLSGNYADFKLSILAAIRNLIIKNLKNEQNRAELSRYGKNYLPILFNLYTKSLATDAKNCDGFRLAIFDTVKVYLEITDRELCETLFSNGMNLVVSKEDAFSRNSILDLMRALLPYLRKESIEKLYAATLPLLKNEDCTTQKKAYRVLEELCLGKNEACTEFVKSNLGNLQKTLATSLSSTALSAKAPRLRCLNYIVLQLNEESKNFLLSIIPEVISCVRESAKKVRLVSISLIIHIAERLIKFGGNSEPDIIKEYIGILLAGLVGSTHLICATITSVAHVINHFRDKISKSYVQIVLSNIAVLGTVNTRVIIGAVLDFLKVITSCFNDVVVASLITNISEILTKLSKPNQSHFRMKIRRIFQRLLRKMGYEMLRDLLPESYQKLLTYVRKQEAKDKKMKATESTRGEDQAENSEFQTKHQTIDELLQDSSSEDEDEMEPQKKVSKTWIHEEAETEIVDLLDPQVSKNILSTKPEKSSSIKAKAKDDFKIASDGRLIITEKKDEKESSDFLGLKSEIKGLKRKQTEDEDDTLSVKDINDSSKFEYNRKFGNAATPKSSYGSEYKAKKAGGDMKKRGKPDPYAYVPLETHSLNKRKKAKMAGKFKTVVRSARKGAQLGKQARSRNKKMKF